MKKLLFILLFLFMLCLISCDNAFFSHSGQKVTVMVVGLDYSPKGSSKSFLSWGGFDIKPLKGTMYDSKEIGASLDVLYNNRDIEHEVIFMLSEGNDVDFSSKLYPTKSNILEKIKSLDLDEDDLFVFYFAGHGFLMQNNTDYKTNLHLITAEPYSGAECTSLDYNSLLEALRTLKCRSAVILDACNSGSFDPKNSTTPETFYSSLKNIFKKNIVLEENNKISVIAAAKWNESSWEGYFINFDDGNKEEHGQFSACILDALGWEHSNVKTTEVRNSDGSYIVANGSQGKLVGPLSMDDLYEKVYDKRSYPNVVQSPVIYYTNETINIVPIN